jgi:hypothetical protein
LAKKRPSFAKRQREQKRDRRKREKAERRARRRAEPDSPATDGPPGDEDTEVLEQVVAEDDAEVEARPVE